MPFMFPLEAKFTIRNIMHHERAKVEKAAQAVIKNCETSEHKEPDKTFVIELGRYLKKRSSEFSIVRNDIRQIGKRAKFINELLLMVKSNDTARQIDALKENNIKEFKGFFTQRLYDLLVARRNSLEVLSRPSVISSRSPR